jgi:hypothetical protein
MEKDITKEELAELMGEKNLSRPQLPNYDLVRFNGKDGVFYRFSENEKKELGSVIDGVIIAVRMSLGEFTKSYYRYSSEFDTLNDNIKIWETQKGSDIAVPIFTGNTKDARKEMPGLRARRILYLYLRNGDIVKLIVKGASLTNLFEFFASDRDGHLFEYWTKLEAGYVEDENLMSYWTITFSLGDMLSEQEFSDMSPKMYNLLKTIKEIRSFYKDNQSDNQPEVPIQRKIEPEPLEEIDYDL